MIPAPLSRAWESADALIDTLASRYGSRLSEILESAQRQLVGWIEQRASLEGEAGGPRFREVLAQMDRNTLAALLRQAGWDGYAAELQTAYLESVRAAAEFYEDIPIQKMNGISARAVSVALRSDLVEFQRLGMDWLTRMQGQLVQMTVSPITIRSAAQAFSAQTGTTIARAETLLNTGLASVQRRLHDEVAATTPDEEWLRLYVGPDDSVCRPFCAALVDKAIPDKLLAKLNNGSGLPVLTSGGGWNCRHSLIPVTPDYVEAEGITIATSADIARANRR